jgi:hypothetical protein
MGRPGIFAYGAIHVLAEPAFVPGTITIDDAEDRMALENWTVKNRSGEQLGIIRKLIIDPRTRQIAYADVALLPTGSLVRVPWSDLKVERDTIILDGSMDDVAAFYYFNFRRPSMGSEVAIRGEELEIRPVITPEVI